MIALPLALLAVLNPVFAETLSTKGAGYLVDRADLSFSYEGGKDFRCFVDDTGRLIPDDNFWEVGPYMGELELWQRINVRLPQAASPKASDWLRDFKDHRVFRDTSGGEWTIIQAVPWQGPGKNVVCESAGVGGLVSGQKPPCYYLVPHGDFAGYRLNWRDPKAPPLSPLTAADLAKVQQQARQDRDAKYDAAAKRAEQMAAEIPTTPAP